LNPPILAAISKNENVEIIPIQVPTKGFTLEGSALNRSSFKL